VTDPAAPPASPSSSSPILLTQSHDLLIESSHTKTDRQTQVSCPIVAIGLGGSFPFSGALQF
jgi:hypothetical protein